MTATAIWRLDNLLLAAVVLVAFGVQTWRMRHELDARRKALCVVVLLVLARDIEGTAENLAQGNPGGPRLLFSTLVYLLILWAVVLGRVGWHIDKDPR
jgi:hypothetical protein